MSSLLTEEASIAASKEREIAGLHQKAGRCQTLQSANISFPNQILTEKQPFDNAYNRCYLECLLRPEDISISSEEYPVLLHILSM